MEFYIYSTVCKKYKVPVRKPRRWKPHERFKRWLMRKHPAEIVGYTRSSHACPLARFLRRKIPNISVGVCYLSTPGHSNPLPPWAEYFIFQIDRGREPRQPIRASQALAALRKCEEEHPNVFNPTNR